MSDLEHAIARLSWFERSPPQIPVLGHFGALQIGFQKKNKQGNVITPHAINLLKTIFWFKFQKIKSKARSNQNPENMIYVKGLIFWGSQALVWISVIGGYFIYFRSMCLIESPSLDVLECKVRSKQKRLSAFFVHHYTNKKLQKHPQQMMTELSIDWPKMKLPKRTFQQSWLEKYKWLKFDPPKGMFCLLCQKANLKSISCE